MMELRKKHILTGFGVILFFFLGLLGLGVAASMSGFIGEFARLCLALVTSPFLMAGTLFFLALTVLLGINAWRRIGEGEDYRELDAAGKPLRDEGAKNRIL